MDSDERAYLWGERHKILYRVELSVLYHQKRERFFESLDKTVKAIAIIGGSASFAAAVNTSTAGDVLLKWATAAIAVASALALVFGFSDRSKRHAELARNFRELEAAIIGRGKRDFDEDDLKVWESKARMLETSEPPSLNLLVLICQNEIAIATGQHDKIVRIPKRKRWFAHIFSFPVDNGP